MPYDARLYVYLVAVFPGLLFAGDYGTVTGRFVFDGDVPKQTATSVHLGGGHRVDVQDETLVVNAKSRGIQNVVIYLSKSPGEIAPSLRDVPKDTAKLMVDDLRFSPRVLKVRAGQTVEISSDDTLGYRIRGQFIRNQPLDVDLRPNITAPIGLAPPPAFVRMKAPEPLPMPVRCDAYSNVLCYWVVIDHPYVAVTDEDGSFTIEDLPVGEHQFRVWHERAGYLDRAFKVTAQAGKTTTLDDVLVDPSALKLR